MKTALIIVAFVVGIAFLIVVGKGVAVIGDIAADLTQPAVSVTTIEYLKITNLDGVEIEIRGLHSEVDTRLLLLFASKVD